MSETELTVADAKEQLRTHARGLRAEAARVAGPQAGVRLAARLLAGLPELGVDKGQVVSAFWPLAGEVDLRPLIACLDGAGYEVALPVVVQKSAPLIFRRWTPETQMEQGAYGTSHPVATSDQVAPVCVITPLLAFDAKGYRVGYGGGYYDRSLEQLRAKGHVVAVGAGYAGQQVETVPHDDKDQPLNAVVTDSAFLTF